MSIRDDTGDRFGMWLFLYTEVILFSGLFILYARHPQSTIRKEVHHRQQAQHLVRCRQYRRAADQQLDHALAITAIQRNQIRLCINLCVATIGLAIVFLINKYFEWSYEINLGIYPPLSLGNG